MKVELSQAEVDVIDDALKAWESDAQHGALLGSILGAVLAKSEDKEKEKARSKEAFSEAEVEQRNRRMKATMLRAKLFSALTEKLIAS